MTDQQVETLRRWAITTMAWERAIKEERGEKLTRLKGVRKMRAALKEVLSRRDVSPAVRGLAAAKVIEATIVESYAA